MPSSPPAGQEQPSSEPHRARPPCPQQLIDRIIERAPGPAILEVEVSTFEEWDPRGRVFDAVVAGGARYGIDWRAGADKAASVLRPGGWLVLFGHVLQPPAEVAAAFTDAFRVAISDRMYTPLTDGDTVERSLRIHRRFAKKISATGCFATPEEWQFEWERRCARDEWLDLLRTTGGLAGLAPDRLETLLDAVGNAIDAAGGEFVLRTVTVAVAADRVVG